MIVMSLTQWKNTAIEDLPDDDITIIPDADVWEYNQSVPIECQIV